MARLSDIEVLFEVSKEALLQIKAEYDASLHKQAVSPKLAVYIKNFLENVRSPLDYIAKEITEKFLATPRKCYFPVSCQNQASFAAHMRQNFPGLDTTSPALYTALENLQAYQPSGLRALPKLSKLVNENKHNNLSHQTRTERRSLDIQFPGGARISLGPGASISGGGVISSGGSWFSPNGGTISGNSPIQTGAGFHQTVTRWISFTFTNTGDLVLDLLGQCLKDAQQAFQTLRPIVWP
jgi:hypothetical protein